MFKIIKNIIEKKRYKRLKKRVSILGHYNLEELETKDVFIISANVTFEEIENFKYIKDNALIKFTYHPQFENQDERPYYDKLKEIFKILEKHNKIYKISIYVENRCLFRQSKVLEHTNNINLIINSDLNQYTKEEYIKEEKILDELVKPIKKSNLSPYEKYIAVYNIVKQFKEYKDNINDPYKSRYIKEILTNEYIVCVGFSNLLTTLLDRVGIPCITISAAVEDTEIVKFLPFSEKPVVLSGHERNLIKIDDDKYNIHGIYMADSTWDNYMKADLYNNVNITYDKLKESIHLEKIRRDDYFFDVHTFDEYQEKINFFLKREIKEKKKEPFKEKLAKSYKYIYISILKLLYKLDYQKWLYFEEIYSKLIEEIDYKKVSVQEIDNLYSNFLTEFGNYILNITNKEIDINKTLEAASKIKRIINKYTEQELEEWKRQTKIIHDEIENIKYPYTYNPNEPIINYLETKDKSKSRIKMK